MKRPGIAIAALVLAAALPLAAHAQVRAYPAAPRAGEDFLVQIAQAGGCGPASPPRAEVTGDTITLAYEDAGVCFPERPPGEPPLGVIVRVASAGVYQVRERGEFRGQVVTSRTAGQLAVQAARAAPRSPLSFAGLWYVPEQAGWGLSITEGESGQLFLAWYSYARELAQPPARGRATWLFASSGTWIEGGRFTGGLYSSEGTGFNRPFDPANLRITPVGVATVTAVSPEAITFSVLGHDGFDEFSRTYDLRRFRF